MQVHRGRLLVSASDIVGFHECEHLTQLELAALHQPLERAAPDEHAELIAHKGREFERRYLERARAAHPDLVRIEQHARDIEEQAAATLEAMAKGVSLIHQATLLVDDRLGRADFLRRVDRPSKLWPWSYEVLDTKLARSPRAAFVLQLAFYSELVAKVQGTEPQYMHVVLGTYEEHSYRCADYSRYFRRLAQRFDDAIRRGGNGAATYPNRCEHCEICHWRDHCEAQRERDDHLCLVAGIRGDQIRKLNAAGIRTVRELASAPPETRIPKLHPETFARLRAQAAIQVRGREKNGAENGGAAPAVLFEPILWPDGEARGLKRLPPPDEGDVYFDMEGDPLYEGGLEYLFGCVYRDEDGKFVFRAFWAHDRDEERRAFEAFMDWLTARLEQYPNAHVYHYAAYERSAIQRLASLHATREEEMDDLLRKEKLVDLYRVVREAFRISRSSYSLKEVEKLYRPPREGEVKTASASVVYYERWLQTQDDALLQQIEDYNEDDCRSLAQLHHWLLKQRPKDLSWYSHETTAEEENGDAAAKRDAKPDPKAEAKAEEHARKREEERRRLETVRARLYESLPADRSEWNARCHARELTAQLLDFHRRCDKPQWWAIFNRQDAALEELLDDTEAIAGLRLIEQLPRTNPRARSSLYGFEYPEQDFKLTAGARCVRLDTLQEVTIEEIDEDRRRVSLRVSDKQDPIPQVLCISAGKPVENTVLRQAVLRYAESVVEGGGGAPNDADGAAGADTSVSATSPGGARRYLALTRLLEKDLPRLRGRSPGEPIVPGEDAPLEAIVDAISRLDDSYLFIQGPPGAGKTYTGSRVILELLREGKRVAVSSNSHKAINNLLKAVDELIGEAKLTIHGAKKCNRSEPDTYLNGNFIADVESTEDALAEDNQLVAGTAWLFANEAADQAFDYLFVDEAGQVSLGHLVAMGTCARNIVLLGDQMQLGQPIQGVHPGRSGESTLDYLLDGRATVAPERGIFLPHTWRMHPDVCGFISEAVYEGRLKAVPDAARQRLVLADGAHPALRQTGLVFCEVPHEGCSQKSEPEARLIREIYDDLLRHQWIDRKGVQRPITPEDILVVAPYNLQVNLLRATLPEGARVGTVDKFQGQEAAVVLISMTTSGQEEMPRNIEFLFSRNRLNVAVSRARSLCVIAASPRLLDVKCTTTDHVALVNTLCWTVQCFGSVQLGGD